MAFGGRVVKEYTKSAQFYETGSPARTRLIAGTGTNALSPRPACRSNAHKLLEKEVVFQSLHPLAAVAALQSMQVPWRLTVFMFWREQLRA